MTSKPVSYLLFVVFFYIYIVEDWNEHELYLNIQFLPRSKHALS
jgi:hypothetical protein